MSGKQIHIQNKTAGPIRASCFYKGLGCCLVVLWILPNIPIKKYLHSTGMPQYGP